MENNTMPPEPPLTAIDNVEVVKLLADTMQRISDLEVLVKSASSPSAPNGRPGRKDSTADIAAFSNGLRPTMSWKGIYYTWKREHPEDPRNKTLTSEKVRNAWRRHFGGKGKKQIRTKHGLND